ncbi:MAG: sigma-70 family RNA polymerase sigma factor [Planctomycetota bacterium]
MTDDSANPLGSNPDKTPPPVDSEESLIDRALEGDATALEQLLLRYYDRLLNYIRLRMPANLTRRVGPEDILQHAYLKAFRAIATFEPRSGYSFFAWLKRIADNERNDQLRKVGREPVATPTPAGGDGESSYFDAVGKLAGDDPTATVLARRRELVAILQVTIAGLKPEYREAVQLRYLQGLSFEEVASQMGITDGQLRGLLHRARRAVKDEIRRLSHIV